MKTLTLIYVILLIPVLCSAQSKKLNLFQMLGLSGSTYKTEVQIPIQQIRYENPSNPLVEKYSAKPDDKTPTPLPMIGAGLIYSLYTESSTGSPLLKVKPRVRFRLPDGTLFKPSDEIPFPPGGAILEIATADSSDFAIHSKSYLFIPEGNKLPNFSQKMLHQWYVSGPFTAMTRFRRKISKSGDLPELDSDVSTGVSLAVVTGAKHSFERKYGRFYKFPISFQLPVFMLGANTIKAKRKVDTNDDNVFDNYSVEENRVSLTSAIGFGFQFGNIAIMPLVGKDYLLGANSKTWAYHGKTWCGVSAGVALDKLVGLSK